MKKVNRKSMKVSLKVEDFREVDELFEVTDMDLSDVNFVSVMDKKPTRQQFSNLVDGVKWLKGENLNKKDAFIENETWLGRRGLVGIQARFELDKSDDLEAFLQNVSHASLIIQLGPTEYTTVWFVYEEKSDLEIELAESLASHFETCSSAKVISTLRIRLPRAQNWKCGGFKHHVRFDYQPLTHVEFVLHNQLSLWVPPAEIDHEKGSREALPIKALPELMQEIVKRFSEAYCCPPEFAFAPLTAMIGSLIGHKLHVKPEANSDLVIAANFWAVSIGDSGAGKSPVHLRMREFFSLLNEDAKQKYREALKQYKARKDMETILYTEKRANIKERIINADKMPETAAKQKLLDSLQAELAECVRLIEKPALQRYTTNRATHAALQKTLGENDNGILMDLEELKGFINQLSGSRGSEYRSFLLECNSGFGQHDIDRLSTGTTYASNMLLSIFATTQPSVLYPFIRNTLNGSEENDGLWQRFNILLHPEKFDEASSVSGEVDTALILKVQQLFVAISQSDFQFSTTTSLKERTVCLTPRAYEVYQNWWDEIVYLKENSDIHTVYENYLSKYKTLVPKLALLFEVVEKFDEVTQVIAPIDAVSLVCVF